MKSLVASDNLGSRDTSEGGTKVVLAGPSPLRAPVAALRCTSALASRPPPPQRSDTTRGCVLKVLKSLSGARMPTLTPAHAPRLAFLSKDALPAPVEPC